MEKALSLAGMSFRRVWADEAESVALQPNRLDPSGRQPFCCGRSGAVQLI